MNKTNDFSKKTRFLLGLLLLVSILTGVVLLAVNNTPKRKVIKSIQTTLFERDDTLYHYLKESDMIELFKSGIYQEDLDLSLDEIRLSSIEKDTYRNILTFSPNLMISHQVNRPNQQAYLSLDTCLATTSVFHLDAYANDTVITLAAPSYFKDSLEIDTKKLASQFNSSALSIMLGGISLPVDIDYTLFKNQTPAYDAEDIKTLISDMQVTKTDKTTILVEDTKRVVQSYLIDIPSGSIFSHAISFSLYLDAKTGDFVRLSQVGDYPIKGKPCHMDLSITQTQDDKKAMTNPMHINIKMTDRTTAESLFSFTASQSFDKENDSMLLAASMIWNQNENAFTVNMDTQLTKNNETSGCTLHVKDITLSNADNVIHLSGNYTLVPMSTDIAFPSGPKKEIFKMKENELEQLFQEISTKVINQ